MIHQLMMEDQVTYNCTCVCVCVCVWMDVSVWVCLCIQEYLHYDDMEVIIVDL